jgi:hypothetical protein
MKNQYYYVFVFGCTDPEMSEAFDTPEERDEAARCDWKEHNNEEHAIFRLMIDENGLPSIGSFVSDELTSVFRNYYKCSKCGHEWDDCWEHTCSMDCPKCHIEIEPYKSEDISEEVPNG